LSCWGSLLAAASAQRSLPTTEETSPGTDYTLPYALVLLCIFLGLFVVLRSSHRRERAKPQGYEEKKILIED
jgi:hypothetical protein